MALACGKDYYKPQVIGLRLRLGVRKHMKPYSTTTKDTCWKDAIACILEIPPKGVPDFVRLYEDSYMDKTRAWLKKHYNKGLVYVPANEFMETGKLRQNGPIGPEGYSIAYVTMKGESEKEDGLAHAVVCFNGGVFWDNGDDRHGEYDHIDGYYVIYDLAPGKAQKLRKPRRKKKRKIARTEKKSS